MEPKIIRVEFGKGFHSPYVTRIVRDSEGEIVDAGTSIYKKTVVVDMAELQAAIPGVTFIEEKP